ncbi:hypothetical protein [Wolbachia endosymbiont (group A) of Pogonocherus hispidulus]|uniref:hypothetical protein n=1 Tax=Wolbachia endosymbiont (group A) of Pogonocherus hispidulus TaxID=3066136 RepID=UPI0033409C6D
MFIAKRAQERSVLLFLSSQHLLLSSQCVTLGSSLYYLVEIKSSGSQCQLLS